MGRETGERKRQREIGSKVMIKIVVGRSMVEKDVSVWNKNVNEVRVRAY